MCVLVIITKMSMTKPLFSDLWSGDRDSSVETGGFHFHGQAIVEVLHEEAS